MQMRNDGDDLMSSYLGQGLFGNLGEMEGDPDGVGVVLFDLVVDEVTFGCPHEEGVSAKFETFDLEEYCHIRAYCQANV